MSAIDCGCAPPVHVETERQRDQRVADDLRARRRAEADAYAAQQEWRKNLIAEVAA